VDSTKIETGHRSVACLSPKRHLVFQCLPLLGNLTLFLAGGGRGLFRLALGGNLGRVGIGFDGKERVHARLRLAIILVGLLELFDIGLDCAFQKERKRERC